MSLVIRTARLRLRAKLIVVFTLIGSVAGIATGAYRTDADMSSVKPYVNYEVRVLSNRAHQAVRDWAESAKSGQSDPPMTAEEAEAHKQMIREVAEHLGVELDGDGTPINPYADEVNELMHDIGVGLAIGAALGFLVGLVAPIGAPDDIRSGGGSGSGGGGVERGAEVTDARTLSRRTKKNSGGITIAGVPIPAECEPLHFLVSGSTGSGKSVAISEILDGANERADADDRALIADVGGQFCERFFDKSRGDIIINPLDGRDVGWSPLAEMRERHDAIRIARAIVPDGHGSSKEWNGYAQLFVSSMLECAYDNNLRNAELQEMALYSNSAELRKRLEKYPVRQMLEESNEKMLASVRGIVATYCEPFRFLNPDIGADGFSIRDFVQGNSGGWVFLTVRDDQMFSLRTLISTIVDVATVGILARNPGDGDARFWLVLDELASFGKITGLNDFLTKARKYGGRGVIGIQSVAQLREIYGRDGAQTLLANLSNALILRTVDAETAEELSRWIGERQLYRENISQSESARSVLSQTKSVSLRLEKERAVLPSEIQALPSLSGYLSLAGDWPTARVQLQPRNRPQRAPAFRPPAARRISAADDPERDNPGGNSGGKSEDDDGGLYL